MDKDKKGFIVNIIALILLLVVIIVLLSVRDTEKEYFDVPIDNQDFQLVMLKNTYYS